MKTFLSFVFTSAATVALPQILQAQRTSTDYTIASDSIDSGGGLQASTDYSQAAAAGGIVGISENPSTGLLAKHGYIGQLYEVLGFGLLASDYYPPELGTTQLIPVRSAGDGTYIPVPPLDVSWSILEGPVSEISLEGLASTSAVYQSTVAIVRGELGAESADLTLYVQDVLPDNFGAYAGDGINDSWQFEFFGPENPLAAPLLDPDGDGQSNRFEFVAGLIPTDPLSRFQLRIAPVPGFPDQKDLIFSPRFEDRIYVVKSNPLLSGPWSPLVDSETGDSGDQRTVTDKQATGPGKFYHVEITKP